MRELMMVGLAALVGCGTQGAVQTAAENADKAEAEVAEAAAKTEAAAEGAAAEAVEAAPAAAGIALADMLGASADHMGKEVTVAGVFGGAAAEGELVQVTLAASGEENAPSVMCMTDKAAGAAFDGTESHGAIMVRGTLAEKDGKPVLENCTKTEAAAADKEAEGGEDAPAEGADAKPEGEAAEAAEGAEGGHE